MGRSVSEHVIFCSRNYCSQEHEQQSVNVRLLTRHNPTFAIFQDNEKLQTKCHVIEENDDIFIRAALQAARNEPNSKTYRGKTPQALTTHQATENPENSENPIPRGKSSHPDNLASLSPHHPLAHLSPHHPPLPPSPKSKSDSQDCRCASSPALARQSTYVIQTTRHPSATSTRLLN